MSFFRSGARAPLGRFFSSVVGSWRLFAAALAAVPLACTSASGQAVTYAQQGPEWTIGARNAFYTQDQGAQMIPLAWFKALKTSDGKPFLGDDLARYGYLPNHDPSNPSGLPVGFTSANSPQGAMAGMTCAACHTRQLTIGGQKLRVDGGPAMADFESFLADLDQAMLDVLADKTKFDAFASAVLGGGADATAVAILRADATVWSVRFHALMSRALPQPRRWGPSRLDAVSMILDRVTGLDLGPAPTYLIPDNIVAADAPARYPFLWNAARQDYTQWPGFSENGNDFFALSRNLGEVLGVFATFHPRDPKGSVSLFNRNYIGNNSANFDGLAAAESYIKRIGPPQWQWPVDAALVAKGKAIFERATETDGTGGCAGCHGISQGQIRLPELFTWKTPILDVGTDRREWTVLTRYAASGSLEGASIVGVVPTILKRDLAITILKASVAGSIAEYEAWRATSGLDFGARLGLPNPAAVSMALPADATIGAIVGGPPALTMGAPQAMASVATVQSATTPTPQLDATFRLPGMRAQSFEAAPATTTQFAYESRVLQGIWAAAPYLHNGSVPTLADLLKPAAERPKTFKIGPVYDLTTVGLAIDQPATSFTLTTTGCDDLMSGDSNCGHGYGTRLPDADKKALLEYLKTL